MFVAVLWWGIGFSSKFLSRVVIVSTVVARGIILAICGVVVPLFAFSFSFQFDAITDKMAFLFAIMAFYIRNVE